MAEEYSDVMSAAITGPVSGNPASLLLIQVSMTTFLSAFQLAFGGHTSAVYAVTRAGLEAALYGYVISKGDDHFERWRNPPKDSRFKLRASEAFRFLEQEGIREHTELKALYNDLISLGAHPNRLAVSRHTTSEPNAEGEMLTFTGIYSPSDRSFFHIVAALSTAALTMTVAGATLRHSKEDLFIRGRSLTERLQAYLVANGAQSPSSTALSNVL